jgi:formylglycine-generating enzyme required for sulfatase activity
MEPIPGGEFVMGSPEGEPGRDDQMEGPQRRFRVDPFWMAKCEVTWAEYKQYMQTYHAFKKFEELGLRKVTDENRIDAITSPTPLYEPDFTFEYGEDDEQPAVTITQYSSKQYSKWLSAVTGQQFRLPTEAEWEYACRAGTTTAYYFGDDASKLSDYAWFSGNSSDEGTRKVGQKEPNAWGLYDMHGNAAEWVLDAYEPYRASDSELNAARDWVRSETLDPRIVRGGSWEFDAAACRAASRFPSDTTSWKETDPNLPKSPWWFTDDPARGVGFRLVRPLQTVPREAMEEFWRIDNEDTKYDVADRLSEGRGVLGIVDKDLPEAISKLED